MWNSYNGHRLQCIQEKLISFLQLRSTFNNLCVLFGFINCSFNGGIHTSCIHYTFNTICLSTVSGRSSAKSIANLLCNIPDKFRYKHKSQLHKLSLEMRANCIWNLRYGSKTNLHCNGDVMFLHISFDK